MMYLFYYTTCETSKTVTYRKMICIEVVKLTDFYDKDIVQVLNNRQ